MIEEANIEAVDIIATGLTVSQYTDSDLINGTFYYGVVAVDAIRYLYISNIEALVVSIPAPSDTTTSPTTTLTTTMKRKY